MNIIFVHHRSPHHAKNSGYGRLVNYIEGQVVYGEIKFPYRLAKFFARRHSQKAGIYNSSSVLKSIELYRLLKKHRKERNIVHFLNGERDIRHLGLFKRNFPNTIFCATFHKPPNILKKSIPDPSHLRNLDAAIAVGDNQVEFLKNWLGLEQVHYIPHGVDTEFFKPNPALKKKNTLLFVGQHLRDFETFNKCIPLLANQIKDLKVNVVMHPAYIPKIAPHPNVEVFTQVDDENLLKFYQEATALFLPLLDSTACNSLLEAMACGLPITSADVGGNNRYLEETQSIICKKKDADGFIKETVNLLRDEIRLKEIGQSAREKSCNLDWKQISKQVEEFYSTLF